MTVHQSKLPLSWSMLSHDEAHEAVMATSFDKRWPHWWPRFDTPVPDRTNERYKKAWRRCRRYQRLLSQEMGQHFANLSAAAWNGDDAGDYD